MNLKIEPNHAYSKFMPKMFKTENPNKYSKQRN